MRFGAIVGPAVAKQCPKDNDAFTPFFHLAGKAIAHPPPPRENQRSSIHCPAILVLPFHHPSINPRYLVSLFPEPGRGVLKSSPWSPLIGLRIGGLALGPLSCRLSAAAGFAKDSSRSSSRRINASSAPTRGKACGSSCSEDWTDWISLSVYIFLHIVHIGS